MSWTSVVRAVVAAVLATAILAVPASAQDPTLRAGVGRSDITPQQTGYYLGGLTAQEVKAEGQHTRLFARALVLQRGSQKIALVSVDLAFMFGGLTKHIAQRVGDLGFSEENIVIQATHTHAGPGGFANWTLFNTATPPTSPTLNPADYMSAFRPTDVQLYSFLLVRIAEAIRRADGALGPASAGWGRARLTGITVNRSLEAHLEDHGIHLDPGAGTPSDDPDGPVHTVDPNVDMLRVDRLVQVRVKCRRRAKARRCTKTRRVPLGGWAGYANHGTANVIRRYTADHHGNAMRILDERIRRFAKVRASDPVEVVYGNGAEGDLWVGRFSPVIADEVGGKEAQAMFMAWLTAGQHMSRTPELAVRWTRTCFCGRATEGGNVSDEARIGLGALSGPEGPLSGRAASPVDDPHQGHKLIVPYPYDGNSPHAVPVSVVRVGDRLIASVPGEASKELGVRIADAVAAAGRPLGIERTVIAGLANDYVLYVTTPEEYQRQFYEGAFSLFGRLEGNFLRDRLVELTRDLVDGQPAPAPYDEDPVNGVVPGPATYDQGADAATITAQPEERYERMQHPTIEWKGGPSGHDRPLDRAFISAERRAGDRWVTVADDLGRAFIWHVDDQGNHRAYWDIPLDAPIGEYRLHVTANRYELISRTFTVAPASTLQAVQVPAPSGRVAIELHYPPAVAGWGDRAYEPAPMADLLYRPATATGGRVRFVRGSRTVGVRSTHGRAFSVRARPGAPVTIRAGGATDLYGNRTANAVALLAE